jgi:hypothetical protein
MCMRCLGVVSQTQKSYSRLIAALRLMNSDGWECELLVGAFTGLSWELRDRNRDEILAFSHVPAHVREHHARRLALDAWSFDGLWNAMKAFAEPGSDGKYEAGGGGAADDLDGIRLIETLVRRFPEAAGERALDTVRKIDPSGKTGLVEVSCVEILGRVKSTAAVPLLLEMLGAGDVDLRRSLIEALARLGSPDLVSRLESIYQDTPSEAERFTIIGILDGINIPETETALTRLLDYESDFDLRRALAGSLIKLCASRDALDGVRELIAGCMQDGDWDSLAERILPAAAMVGYEPPEFAEWRQEIDRRKGVRKASWLEEFGAVMGARSASPPLPALSSGGGNRGAQPAGTARRSAPRVGRNDTCPCGSGKKYKKCCMRE